MRTHGRIQAQLAGFPIRQNLIAMENLEKTIAVDVRDMTNAGRSGKMDIQTEKLIQKIKDNAHLIAADYECMEAVLADDTESRYTHECAKTVFAERFIELMKGEPNDNT